MSNNRERVGDKTATADALSSAQAAVRGPSKVVTSTAVTAGAPATPKAPAAVDRQTPQRSDDRPPKRRSSIGSQASQASRSSRSKRKQRKQKADDDLQSQRRQEAKSSDVNHANGPSGSVVLLSPAGPLPTGVISYDNASPAVPFAHPIAPDSDAVLPAGTVLPDDVVLPADANRPFSSKVATATLPAKSIFPATSAELASHTASPTCALPFDDGGVPAAVPLAGAAAGTIPTADAVSPSGPVPSTASDVTPATVQYSANVAALVNSARALLSPPNTRPLEADSRRTSVASVAAALVFKPKTMRRWRMNEFSRGADSSAPEPSTHSLNTPAILIGFCSVVLILVFFFVFVGTRKTADKEPVCDTSDCRLHRYMLESGLDPSIDPCENFSAYVCAKWKPRHRSARSTLSDMVFEWLSDLPERLRRGATQLPATTKATNMFDVCMNQVESTADAALRFLRDRGLEWLNDSADGSSSPAEVLFDLAFNWQVPLWFRIQMLPKSQEYPHQLRLLFAPNDLISQWAPFFNDINEQLYVRYWTIFYHQLTSGNATPPTKAAINESFHVQRFVFDVLLKAATNRNRGPPCCH
ncbi:hypothetical protein HPB50_023721 [Hyalomma asiaticum]|uniref:Uncharacterized protein n=1 Tax=Hyalomma asiaticum TaxID=266040 RepID=A0ACB7SNR9_HYAAI|nr:hypothetical protein HPB50_023721 [Hyalomma asiaticum]